MKSAAIVFKEEDCQGLTGYEKLLEKIKGRLDFCREQNISIVVFPALLGCIFTDGDRYINDIIELSDAYKGMAICPGSFYEREAGHTYHSSCIITGGSIAMKQRQLYLAKWEKSIGLSRGTVLNSIFIGGMRAGMIVSTDVFYPQVSRALAMSGVELVLSPVAIKGKGNISRQLSGLWQNVQANLFFGIESGFKGSLNGCVFHGRSIIHAPLPMTEKENGFMAIENNTREGMLVAAELDSEKRKEAVRRFNTLAQLNPEAYKDIFMVSGGEGYDG
ncbi:MAG TPA: nitrilase-related carbon-nitrogen hydrolase [Clostridia bacterium]|nr:nitrilase-related carbon-nitrogen hydrolase [Clostridia bacterium]